MAEATESGLTRSSAPSLNQSSPWVALLQAGASWRSCHDRGLGGKAELWWLSLQPMPAPPWGCAKGLFDLLSEMYDFYLHPSVLPVLSFWLQKEAVIASAALRWCVITLSAGHMLGQDKGNWPSFVP